MKKEFEDRLEDITIRLMKQLAGVHAGRVTPAVLDSVQIDVYGQMMPIHGIANIQSQPPYTLLITPWDEKNIQAIEKAIMQADVGAHPVVDGSSVRLTFQPPTAEKRAELAKKAEALLEEAKISAKGSREDAMRSIKDAVKNGELREDDGKAEQERVQEVLQSYQKKWADSVQQKVTEITSLS